MSRPPKEDSESTPKAVKAAPMSSRNVMVLLIGSLIAIVLLYAWWPYQHGHLDYRSSVFRGVVMLMELDTEWIFCPFIPLLVGFLMYRKRKLAMKYQWEGSLWAIVPLVLAAALYWLGYKADTRYAGFASAQLMVGGILLWFGGWRLFKMMLFPWMFLVFTWPMLPLEEELAFPLRQITTDASSQILNLIGVENVKTGTALVSAANPAEGLEEGARFSLDVEAPCSGIRSLFSLMMISAFYGYIALRGGIRQSLLFLSSIPLAVLGNFVRILMLTFGSMFFGTEFAIGTNDQHTGELHSSRYHMFSGFCVFAVALAGMFGIARLLERLPLGKPGPLPLPSRPAMSEQAAFNSAIIRSSVIIALAVVLLMICASSTVSSRLSDPGLVTNEAGELILPAALPEHGYNGEDIGMSSKEKQAFDEGVQMARSVYFADGKQFLCTAVLSGPVKRSLHKPEVCLPGQGWKIGKSEVVTLESPEGKSGEATMLHLYRDYEGEDGRRMRSRAYNLYWYVGHGVSTPSYRNHVIYSHRDSVFKNINHRWGMASVFGAMPPVPVTEADPLQEDVAMTSIREFAGLMLPHLQNF